MLIDYNPLTGESVTFQYDHATDQVTIGHHHDCTDIIDWNKRQVIEADHKAQMKNDFIKYATIPNIVIMKWKQEGLANFFDPNDWPRVMALINSRDYCYLKTSAIHHDR